MSEFTRRSFRKAHADGPEFAETWSLLQSNNKYICKVVWFNLTQTKTCSFLLFSFTGIFLLVESRPSALANDRAHYGRLADNARKVFLIIW